MISKLLPEYSHSKERAITFFHSRQYFENPLSMGTG